jgi:hypothetical protein
MRHFRVKIMINEQWIQVQQKNMRDCDQIIRVVRWHTDISMYNHGIETALCRSVMKKCEVEGPSAQACRRHPVDTFHVEKEIVPKTREKRKGR